MNASVIVSGVRTPVGRFLGALSSLSATRLGSIVVQEVLRRAGVPAGEVDEVILGNVISAGLGQNPARQVALGAGMPPTISALTINKVCGSGLKAVMLADQAIRAGDAEVVVAGGMESMSNAPFLLQGGRRGLKYGNQELVDSMIRDGLWCAFENWHMGCAAEHIARRYLLSRAEQDAFALESHRRAVSAIRADRFREEMVPVEIRADRGGIVRVEVDECPRADTSLEKLAALPPVFDREGTVTAGNAPGLNDGAAAVLVMSEGAAQRRGLRPLARIRASAVAGVPPKEIFVAPVPAVQRVLEKARLRLGDLDALEVNEAFSAQVLACRKELTWEDERVNVNGGAVALGHPIGASGARVLVTLLHVLRQRSGRLGLATLCLGGGNAVAMVVERVE
ncbi:MAG: acetyl-CoA C-acetyltransferase [Planctomycetes bacterium]|nr:acetyl-CoA C-acetyltransferase [Planctomycetota bacterium]